MQWILHPLREFSVTRKLLRLPQNEIVSVNSHLALLNRAAGFENDSYYVVETAKLEEFAFPKSDLFGKSVSIHSFRLLDRRVASARLVFELHNAYFWAGSQTAIWTSDGHVLENGSRSNFPISSHPCFARGFFPTPSILKGKTACLVTKDAHMFHHTLYDLLPRCVDIAIAGFSWNDFDQILINSHLKTYQIEMLEHAGIPTEKLLPILGNRLYKIEQCFLPTLKEDNYHVSKFEFNVVKDIFPGSHSRGGERKIYCSRLDAGRRCFDREEEVIGLARSRGYEIVEGSRLSWSEKAQLFGDARLVIGLSGSIFDNLFLAPTSCHLVEIFANGFYYPTFFQVATHAGLNYHFYDLSEGNGLSGDVSDRNNPVPTDLGLIGKIFDVAEYKAFEC